MNIFRIFFVSTVLIPVLVVVATSDEQGLRIRRPRNIVISEDGARTGRRHKPVNISDRNCPSLGCTGNLTTDSYNGKGSLAPPTKLSPDEAVLSPNKERRFDSSSATTATSFHHDHHHPLKLEIKSINDSARSDTVDYNNYVVSQDSIDEVGSGRGLVKTAVIISWLVYWAGKAFISFIVINIFKYVWNKFKKAHGIGDDYIEYYVKLGNDAKHPFHNYGAGWNPTFGVSLKSKHEDHGWKGAGGALTYQPHHASSYQYPQGHGHEHWPPPYYAGAQDYGWHHGKGWKSESEEAEDELKHNFDMEKGWKYAQKYAKKYGKKAHKYGLRPSKYSYMFDENGNIVLGDKGYAFGWKDNRRR